MEQHGSRFEQFTDFEVSLLYQCVMELNNIILPYNKKESLNNLVRELRKENLDRELIENIRENILSTTPC